MSIPASVAASLHAFRVGHASSAAVASVAVVMRVVAVATEIDFTFMFVVCQIAVDDIELYR